MNVRHAALTSVWVAETPQTGAFGSSGTTSDARPGRGASGLLDESQSDTMVLHSAGGPTVSVPGGVRAWAAMVKRLVGETQLADVADR